jgi:hypothetical protein
MSRGLINLNVKIKYKNEKLNKEFRNPEEECRIRRLYKTNNN